MMKVDATSSLVQMNNRGVEFLECGRILSANEMFIQALLQSQKVLRCDSTIISSCWLQERWKETISQPRRLEQADRLMENPNNSNDRDEPVQTPTIQSTWEWNVASGEESCSMSNDDDLEEDDRSRIYVSGWKIRGRIEAPATEGSEGCIQIARSITIVVLNLALTCHLVALNETMNKAQRDTNDGWMQRFEATAGLYELTIMLQSTQRDFFKWSCFSMPFFVALNNLGHVYDLLGQRSKAHECYARLLSFLTLLNEFDFATTSYITSRTGTRKNMILGLYSNVVSILFLKRPISAPAA